MTGVVTPAMPALFTRMSILPSAAAAAAVPCATDFSSATSTASPLTGPDRADSVCCSNFWSRSQMRTLAPEASMRLTMASPMPCAPPVTMAARLFKSILFIAWISKKNCLEPVAK